MCAGGEGTGSGFSPTNAHSPFLAEVGVGVGLKQDRYSPRRKFCWTLPSVPLGCPVQTQSPMVGQAVARAAGSLVCVGLCAMGAPDSGSRLASRFAGPCGVPALGSLGPNLGQGKFLPTLPGGCGQPQNGLVLALCPKPSCWPPPPHRALALGALSWGLGQWRRAVFFSLLTA